MAIALRGTIQSAVNSAGVSATVTKPTGVINGDLLIAGITGFKSSGSGVPTPNTPSGWTLIGTAQSTIVSDNNTITGLYYRYASGEPANYTLSLTQGTGDNYIDADIAAYSGVDPVTPFNLTSLGNFGNGTASASSDLGSTNRDSCWHYLHYAAYGGYTAPTLSGYTQDVFYDGDSIVYHKVISPAGATGSKTQTTGGATDGWVVWALALQPPGTSVGPAIGPINPGAPWQRFYWLGLKHPIAIAPVTSGPVSNIATATESLSALTDTPTRILSLPRAFTDSLNAISDTSTRIVATPRISSDAISTPSDAATRSLLSFIRSSTESLSSLSESATRILTLFQIATDSPSTLSDIANRIVSLPRTISDNLAATSDIATALKVILRSATDTLGATSETAVRTAQLIRTVTDSFNTLSDTATKTAQSLIRTALDNPPTISDTATAIKVILRTAVESLSTISETTSRLLSLPRSPQDSLPSISDILSRTLSSFRNLTDVISLISDQSTRNLNLSRSAGDTLAAISDTISRAAISYLRIVADTLSTITETPSRGLQSFLRSALDTISSISDTALNASNIVISFVTLINFVRNGSLVNKVKDGTLRVFGRDSSIKNKGK